MNSITKHLLRAVLPLFSVLILPAALSSCTDPELKNKEATQETSIESYMNAQFKDMEIIRKNGSNRVVLEKAENGKTLEYGDSVYFYYAGYIFISSPSELFATNVEPLAHQAQLNLTDPDFSIKRMSYRKNSLVEGLENGMYGMKEGEHALILFSSQYGFKNKTVHNIPKMSALAYEIWLQKIIKN